MDIDEQTIRQTIINIRRLLKDSNNHAAKELAKISANTLEGYLPEVINKYKQGVLVSIQVVNGFPECYDQNCPLKKKCANHYTAGEHRYADGIQPDLFQKNGSWQCTQADTRMTGAFHLK